MALRAVIESHCCARARGRGGRRASIEVPFINPHWRAGELPGDIPPPSNFDWVSDESETEAGAPPPLPELVMDRPALRVGAVPRWRGHMHTVVDDVFLEVGALVRAMGMSHHTRTDELAS